MPTQASILSYSRASSTPPASQTEKEYEKAAQIKSDDFGENERDALQLGRAITYHNIPADAWRDVLIAHGLPAHVVHHLMTIAELHRAGRYDRMSGDVLTVSAQSPMTVEQFVRKNAGAFT